jgi:glycosyltransferase involved in cell wall biosynthesis
MRGGMILKIYLYVLFLIKLFYLIRVKRNSFVLAYDPIALAMTHVVRTKKIKVWYHNHDLLEVDKSSSIIQKLVKKLEVSEIDLVDIFTLPSVERKEYFNLNKYNGFFSILPNYPSLKLYKPFFERRELALEDSFNILFQGSIGPGHGIEDFIKLLPKADEIMKKRIKLNLKGKVDDKYRSELEGLALALGVSDGLVFHSYTTYDKVPELTSKCHLGIAIFTKSDTMNATLGTASNKIYEYAASGTPIVYYNSAHFEKYLGQFEWAFATDLSEKSLINIIKRIETDFVQLSLSAYSDFRKSFNFEYVVNSVLDSKVLF